MKIINSNNTKKFLNIFFSIISVFLIVIVFIFLIFKYLNAEPAYDPNKQKNSTLFLENDIENDKDKYGKHKFTAPVRTNVMIVGLDKGESLTDVIMIASFISTTGEINLMSIPRDTYINFTGESLKELRNINKRSPNVMKINAVNAYGGKKEGIKLLTSTLEKIFDIKIDYYIKVDLDAFKSIVDAVGGVYFDVPKGGLKYSDPVQDLYINLKEGYQLLDGNAAEGLVRFRKGYVRQDLQRVEVQQEFIREFVKQTLNKKVLIDNMGSIALNIIKYVETDFGISDLPKYLKVIRNIDIENINSGTACGEPRMIDGAAYYILDKTLTKEIIDKFFYGNTDPESIEVSSKPTL